MLAAYHLVALYAPFVGRRHIRAAGDDVIIADIATGADDATAIGGDGFAVGGNGIGGGGESADGDLIIGELIANGADGLIVGTSLKFDGRVSNPVDPQRVRSLVEAMRRAMTDAQ